MDVLNLTWISSSQLSVLVNHTRTSHACTLHIYQICFLCIHKGGNTYIQMTVFPSVTKETRLKLGWMGKEKKKQSHSTLLFTSLVFNNLFSLGRRMVFYLKYVTSKTDHSGSVLSSGTFVLWLQEKYIIPTYPYFLKCQIS